MSNYGRQWNGASVTGTFFLPAILFFTLMLMPSGVISCPPEDTDCDGFSDQMEARGFSLFNEEKFYPPCDDSTARADCVDPLSPDLFIVLDRQLSGSLIPQTTSIFDPYEFISRPQSEGGLGIAVHEVDVRWVGMPDRRVTVESEQKAILVLENTTRSDYDNNCDSDLDPPLSWIDPPGRGTPNDGLDPRIYIRNIVGYVDFYCKDLDDPGICIDIASGLKGEAGECDLTDGELSMEELDGLDYHLIKRIIATEVGHQLMLTPRHHPAHGFYHHPGRDCIMSKLPRVREWSGGAEFEISTSFCRECMESFRLH